MRIPSALFALYVLGISNTAAPRRFVTWTDRYSVGVARIDEEHQRLLDLVNELHAAIVAGTDAAIVGKVLAGLSAYTLTHFEHEELILRRSGYPDVEYHEAEHQKLVAQLQGFQQDFRAGNANVAKNLLVFLQKWLIGHILLVDRKYASHLKAAGVT